MAIASTTASRRGSRAGLLALLIVSSACSASDSGGSDSGGWDSPPPVAESDSAVPVAVDDEQPVPEPPAGQNVEESPPAIDFEVPQSEPNEAEPAPQRLELVEVTLPELRRAIATRLVTPAELVQRYRARIAAYDDDGPELNAYLSLNDDALGDAQALGNRCEAPDAPPLCGIPVVIKDNVDAAGLPTTAGSLAMVSARPSRDAFLMRRLREAGAVLIGKATLTEFANFLTAGMPAGYSSLGGFGYNPFDPRRQGDGRPVLSPGGSSSGPAIAVSANLAAVGVGTETSGSILSPGSSNGIVGIKPTLGLVSRSGIVPISADQDTAGPFARTVADAAALLGVMSGHDPDDSATAACLEPGRCPADYAPFLDADALLGARIAVPPFGGLAAIDSAIEVLEARGAEVRLIDAVSSPNNGIVLNYGFQRDLNAYLAQTPGGPATLAEIIEFNQSTAGALRYGQTTAVAAQRLDLSPGSDDTRRYQSDRSQALAGARSTLDGVYSGNDGIAGTDDDVDALLFSGNTGAAAPAIAGYPSITLPGAARDQSPSGVTFSGPAFSEARLIALAYAFEQATLLRRPPDSAPALPGDVIER